MGGETDTQLLIELGRKIDVVGRDVSEVRERVARVETEQRGQGERVDALHADVRSLRREGDQREGARRVTAAGVVSRRFILTSIISVMAVAAATAGAIAMLLQ